MNHFKKYVTNMVKVQLDYSTRCKYYSFQNIFKMHNTSSKGGGFFPDVKIFTIFCRLGYVIRDKRSKDLIIGFIL